MTKARIAAGVVQYCKNCLLVSIHCLFPPVLAFAWQCSNHTEEGGDILRFIDDNRRRNLKEVMAEYRFGCH